MPQIKLSDVEIVTSAPETSHDRDVMLAEFPWARASLPQAKLKKSLADQRYRGTHCGYTDVTGKGHGDGSFFR